MLIIPALGRQRQEDHEFKVSLGYTARLCLKKKDNKKKRTKNKLNPADKGDTMKDLGQGNDKDVILWKAYFGD
jgi:hypothetical protein